MRAVTILGIILIVAGIAALAVKSIEYTTHDTVIDAGPVQVETEEENSIPLGPVAGGAALVAGLVLVGVGRRG
jgi:uncharacterized membrane protein